MVQTRHLRGEGRGCEAREVEGIPSPLLSVEVVLQLREDTQNRFGNHEYVDDNAAFHPHKNTRIVLSEEHLDHTSYGDDNVQECAHIKQDSDTPPVDSFEAYILHLLHQCLF